MPAHDSWLDIERQLTPHAIPATARGLIPLVLDLSLASIQPPIVTSNNYKQVGAFPAARQT